VAIAPLRIARGIQNKVLEAAAMSKAIVASPQALVGLEFEHGTHALCAAEPQQWASALDALLSSAEQRRRLGRNARRLVEERYRWEARLAPLADVLTSITGDTATVVARRGDALVDKAVACGDC
jgi:glycosyltransferase involved in cell wall biosynthesis